MGKLKKVKGITLIALIITIIVLLILAGITINLTIGQNGIMNMAEQAGKNYIEAEEKEEEILLSYENKIGEYISSNRNLEELKEFRKIIAEAITKRGIETSENDSATTMAENINNIKDQEIIYPYIWGSVNTTNASYEFSKIRNKIIYIDSVSTVYIYKGSQPTHGSYWQVLYNTSGYVEIDVEELISNYNVDVNEYPYLTTSSNDYYGYNMHYAK